MVVSVIVIYFQHLDIHSEILLPLGRCGFGNDKGLVTLICMVLLVPQIVVMWISISAGIYQIFWHTLVDIRATLCTLCNEVVLIHDTTVTNIKSYSMPLFLWCDDKLI